MANKTRSSAVPLISIFVVLVAITGQSVAGRNVPENSNKDDKKEPEWLIGHDKSFLIPGLGRVLIPPLGHVPHYKSYAGHGSTGGSGSGAVPSGVSGSGSAPGSRNYVPGGDDTFVPNPGYEVPTPGNVGGNVPASAKP